ncbi:uncharacterized protein N7482_001486 [Penicillium canariense]|uniref:Uncharacterized protein n=1 Tax=Penicillium canariense TaxID=189055 RepID=A0A9W9LTY0_9EURO|nr:uncharacterized protein N7482_001486 [Penicillium canariense]KAJ5175609.1 hypothetical protein N7482_001486 [Penicillium canariense]
MLIESIQATVELFSGAAAEDVPVVSTGVSNDAGLLQIEEEDAEDEDAFKLATGILVLATLEELIAAGLDEDDAGVLDDSPLGAELLLVVRDAAQASQLQRSPLASAE